MKLTTRFDFSLLKTVNFWITIALSLLVAAFYLLSRPEIGRLPAIGLLEIIEDKSLDLRFLLRGAVQPREDIVIVALDEQSEDELGRWQSSGRQWLAKLLNILHEGNAAVVGFDLTLAEADEGSGVRAIEETIAHYKAALPDEFLAYPGFLSYLDDAKIAYNYDLQLAQAIQQNANVVLGLYFLNHSETGHLSPETEAEYRELIRRTAYRSIQRPAGTGEAPLRVRRYEGVEPNLPLFSDAARSFGHFNVTPDRDGFIRFSSLLIDYHGDYYPSLALEVARAFLNPSLPPIVHALGAEGAGNIQEIRLGSISIPCDERGRLFINYYGPEGMFRYYSLSDVLQGKVESYKFADKIVLFGVTSKIIQDEHSAPFQNSTFPGVEINATIVENILRQDFLTRPEWCTLLETLVILFLGLLLSVVRHHKSPLWSVWTSLICLAALSAAAYLAFRIGKIWLNVSYPALFILLDYLTITSYNYFTEARQKRELKDAFQHYVSPKVVEEMLDHIDTLQLGGERRLLTAFFSDIRGFTPLSENMSPELLVQFLNEYFSEMTQLVLKYEGTVDKYMGDAIMAFYGAPLEQADHAKRACKTAVDMMIRLRELQAGWEARGLPSVDIGIGINSGEMSVGNMGSDTRFDYTIMGDNVNLAAHLEGANKEYGSNIIISEFTYQLIQDDSFLVRSLDTVRVRGKETPVTVYELIGYGNYYAQKKPLVETFCHGLQAYKQQEWAQAIALFEEALALDPDDGPSRIYVDRCAEYAKNPPPEDWDGVFVMPSK